jgi:glycosyltransferase involved in cell wall biosynthesis
MRIALFYNLPSGGAKRTIQEQVTRLGHKHQIDVYSLSTANHDFADLRPSVAHHRVYEFKPMPLFRSPFGRLNNLVRLVDLMKLRQLDRIIANQIRQGSYDAVLVHPCQFEIAPSLLRFEKSMPKVYYCHEPPRIPYEPMPKRPYDKGELTRKAVLNKVDPLLMLYREYLRRNDRTNTRGADKILVNSKYIQAAVRRIYNLGAFLCYHGVNADLFRPLGLEKRNIVLSVGSLTPLKGFDFLIRAMAELPEAGRPRLVIASNFQNSPEKTYLEDLAGDLRVELELLNNISDLQLVELYNQAKMVLYSPVREPFGLVPLEAMACRTPVVGVREGGVLETVLDGETGFLVERDIRLFADAIKCLLDDPELGRAFGQRGRMHVSKEWTWDVAISRLEGYLLN